jgi:hypothetical protein
MAQFGAAVGREFPYALLEAITPMKEGVLREGLGRLVEAELVYQRGLPPKAPERALWGLLVRTVDIGGGEKAAYSSYPRRFRAAAASSQCSASYSLPVRPFGRRSSVWALIL